MKMFSNVLKSVTFVAGQIDIKNFSTSGQGDSNVIECAYVKSSVSEAEYFSNPLLFGKNGVAKNLRYGELNTAEQQLLKNALPELMNNMKTGEKFILQSKKN